MKPYLFVTPILVLMAFLLSGCSGLISNPMSEKGRVVSPQHIARFRGGGSISTLWYRGSDQKYHYFAHLVKVSTLYRVPRQELQVPDEFPLGSRESVFVGDAPFLRNL